MSESFVIKPGAEYDVFFRVTGVDAKEKEFYSGTIGCCGFTFTSDDVTLYLEPYIDGVPFTDLSFSIKNWLYHYNDPTIYDLGNLMTVGDRFSCHHVKVVFPSTTLDDLLGKLEDAAMSILEEISE